MQFNSDEKTDEFILDYLDKLPKRERFVFGLLRFLFRRVGAVLPGPLSAFMFTIFRSPRRYDPPSFEREIAKEADALRFEHRGRALHAHAWGPEDGPKVMLLPGWEGRGAQLGRFMGPLVTEGFRVIALDPPAHGASEGKATDALDTAEALVAVGAELGPLHGIVSHSFGTAATRLAIARGLQVDRVVFLSPPANLARVLQRYAILLDLAPAVYRGFVARLSKRIGEDAEAIDFPPPAPELEIEGLIVHDRDDVEVPIVDGEQLHARWPTAALLATEGLGHRRILKDQRVTTAVARFIATGDAAALPEIHAEAS